MLRIKPQSYSCIAVAGIVFLAITLFIVWFVGQERFIYFWDSALYQNFWRDLGGGLVRSPLIAIKSVFVSVRTVDYNYLPAVFLLPFYLLFGSGRLSYILSIAITFAFPAIILFTNLIRNLRGNSRQDSGDLGEWLLTLLTLALLPQLWGPLLLGYVDACGLVVIFLIYGLYFRSPLSEKSLRSLVLIGLLLSFLVLLRRWYAYWVVGFFVAMGASVIVNYLRSKSRQVLIGNFKNILIIGVTAVLLMFVIATPIAIKMLFTNYSDIYSAYQSNGIFSHLKRLYSFYGLIILLPVIIGVIAAWLKEERRPLALFLCIQFAITYFVFTRVQVIDVHQHYWITPMLMIFVVLLVTDAYSALKGRVMRNAFVIVVAVLCLSNFLIVLNPRTGAALHFVRAAYPALRIYPKQRNDLPQVHELLMTLNKLTENSDDKIYVLSSSISMNSSILKGAVFEFEPSLRPLGARIVSSSDVDKRDGFPFQFLRAKYVVVTDPIGYHLSPVDQRVVGILAEGVLNQQGIGSAFEKMPFQFALEDGRQVYVYQKTRPFLATELQEVSQTFVALYPAHKEKFLIKPEMIRELSAP